MYALQLDLDADQLFFGQTCRGFLEKEYPLTLVRERLELPAAYDRDLWRREAGLGWFGLLAPESVGGGSITGSGVADAAVVAAELGRALHPGPVHASAIVAAALAAGSAAQRELASALVSGAQVAAWCIGDAAWLWGAGVPAVVGRAGEGDGLVLSGTVPVVPDAGAASHLLITFGVETGGGWAPRQAIVPVDAAGVRVETLESLDLTRGMYRLHLDDVVVGGEALVGADTQVGSGAFVEADVLRQFDLAALLQTVDSVAAAERVYEFTLQYAMDRIAFGRPIGSYQAVKHRLADLLVWLESCKATVDAAVRAADGGDDDTSHLVSVAAAYVGDTVPRLVQECVQLHGGIGLTWEHDIHLYLRRVTANSALLGRPSLHRRRLDSLLTPPSA